MNYNEFIKIIDEKLAAMSNNEKGKWIHDLARTIKEEERDKFLNSLDGNNKCNEIIYDIKEIQDWSEKVQNGDIYFECSYREVYDENHWRDYYYEYYDNHEIGKMLTFAFQVAENLLCQKRYNEAVDLYNMLMDMSFQAYDVDDEETIDLELEELIDEKLVSLNFKQIMLNLMYAKYQTSRGKERVAALFTYFKSNFSRDIKLDELFLIGPEELAETDVFLEEWITFLKCEDGDLAGSLLFEACILQGGIEKLWKVAKEAAQRHPLLYLKACECLLDKKREAECEKLGLEAINILGETLVTRGKVADLTAKAARKLGHEEIVLECYKVAFNSESTLNHYLRLHEIEDGKNIVATEVRKFKKLPEKSAFEFGNINNQMKKNHISKEQKKILLFFSGEFDSIYEECEEDKTYLGWSDNIKGVIVPLFLLCLDRNKHFSKAGEKVIDEIKYRLNYSEEDEKSFLDRFLTWKDKIKITNEQYEKYITWLQKEVDKRTEAIVGGGFRKSYYKAEGIIALLGEVMESNGNIGAKEIIIEHYKKVHSKKRAFKAELEDLK